MKDLEHYDKLVYPICPEEKQRELCSLLKREGVHAFLPMMDYYRRDRKGLAEKPMYPGYIFVQSELTQKEFDDLLDSMEGRRWGFIRQLKEDEGGYHLWPIGRL